MTRAPNGSLRLNGATVLFLVAADTQTWKELLCLAAKYIVDSDSDVRICVLIKLEQKKFQVQKGSVVSLRRPRMSRKAEEQAGTGTTDN